MENVSISQVEENKDELKRKEKLIKRHAQESWVYPIATVVLSLFGLPIAFLNIVTFFMGIYCLIKSYINIKNGKGKGIIPHVVVGTILNLIIASLQVIFIFYFIKRNYLS